MAILTSCQATFTDMASVEVGGRNLVLHSDTEVTFKDNYKLYELSEYGKQIVSGRIIIFSLDACSDTDGVTIDVYLRQIVDEVGSSCNEVVASIKNVGTTYKRYSIAVKIKESDYIMHAAVRSSAKSGDGYSTTATVSAKNIKVEIGDVATDWTLAPEDVDEDISQVEQSKNRVWYQTSAPSGTSHRVNDVWFDTDNNNAMYMWSGSKWVLKTFGTTAISDDAITTAKIYAGAVTASEIATGAVTASKIASESITTDKLTANAVTAAKIDVDDLFAQDITATGTISGAKLRGEDISIQASSVTQDEDHDGWYTTSIVTTADESTGVRTLQLEAHSKGGDSILRMCGETTELESDFEVTGNSVFYGSIPRYSSDRKDAMYFLSPVQYSRADDEQKWNYEKYVDGRLRCTARIPIEGISATTTLGSLYRSAKAFDTDVYAYPIAFTSIPNTQYSFVTSNSAGAIVWIYDSGSTTTPPACYLIRTASTSSIWGYVNVVAEGYWK